MELVVALSHGLLQIVQWEHVVTARVENAWRDSVNVKQDGKDLLATRKQLALVSIIVHHRIMECVKRLTNVYVMLDISVSIENRDCCTILNTT